MSGFPSISLDKISCCHLLQGSCMEISKTKQNIARNWIGWLIRIIQLSISIKRNHFHPVILDLLLLFDIMLLLLLLLLLSLLLIVIYLWFITINKWLHSLKKYEKTIWLSSLSSILLFIIYFSCFNVDLRWY